MVSMMITRSFIELGRTVEMIAPLKIEEAVKQQALLEHALDNNFCNLFKPRSLHVCWQVFNCVFLILPVL